jgi:two-component system response regulator WspF
MKIAIVNDSPMAVEALRRVVTSVDTYGVAWVAHNGREAVEKCRNDRPDIILMDLIMPEVDGVEATRRIMAECPCAILVVTATVSGNCERVYEAMGHGALDAVSTPVLGQQGGVQGGSDLLQKIATIGTLIHYQRISGQHASPSAPASGGPPLLAIGASTGGPQAIVQILGSLPVSFPAAVVVIQHVDRQFADGLANWLAERCNLPVETANVDTVLEPGRVWLAASNDHLVVDPDFTLHYTSRPRDLPYRPSVDVFLESAARCRVEHGCAVLLTGMGRDGARGLLTLRNLGWFTIAQNKATSVVYGMPKAAAELNAASQVLPVDDIPGAIKSYFQRRLGK